MGYFVLFGVDKDSNAGLQHQLEEAVARPTSPQTRRVEAESLGAHKNIPFRRMFFILSQIVTFSLSPPLSQIHETVDAGLVVET